MLPMFPVAHGSHQPCATRILMHPRQVAEVAVPQRLFRAILERIRRLRLPEAVPG